jgi:hypothetical protein
MNLTKAEQLSGQGSHNAARFQLKGRRNNWPFSWRKVILNVYINITESNAPRILATCSHLTSNINELSTANQGKGKVSLQKQRNNSKEIIEIILYRKKKRKEKKNHHPELLVLLNDIVIILAVHGEVKDGDLELLHILHDLEKKRKEKRIQ